MVALLSRRNVPHSWPWRARPSIPTTNGHHRNIRHFYRWRFPLERCRTNHLPFSTAIVCLMLWIEARRYPFYLRCLSAPEVRMLGSTLPSPPFVAGKKYDACCRANGRSWCAKISFCPSFKISAFGRGVRRCEATMSSILHESSSWRGFHPIFSCTPARRVPPFNSFVTRRPRRRNVRFRAGWWPIVFLARFISVIRHYRFTSAMEDHRDLSEFLSHIVAVCDLEIFSIF